MIIDNSALNVKKAFPPYLLASPHRARVGAHSLETLVHCVNSSMRHLAPPLAPGSRARLPTQVDKRTAKVLYVTSPIFLQNFTALLDDVVTSLHGAGAIAVEAVFEGARLGTCVVLQPEWR